jgi:phosphoadenosine phosphosulfate reductase
MGLVQTQQNLCPDRHLATATAGVADLAALQLRALDLGSTLTPLSLDERLTRMRAEIAGRIVFTTSFGREDQLILHVLQRHRLAVEVVTLDTGRLFPETYQVWMANERRYGIRIGAVYPRHEAVESLIAAQGINGFYESMPARLACCHARKIEPLDRCLAGAAAWITGIRTAQSDARRGAGLVEVDAERRILKFNPLFDWSSDAVVNVTVAEDIPVNALHAEGFASIGCAPCTRALHPDEPERAGRWWWENDQHKECGLHRRGAPQGAAPCSEAAS